MLIRKKIEDDGTGRKIKISIKISPEVYRDLEKIAKGENKTVKDVCIARINDFAYYELNNFTFL